MSLDLGTLTLKLAADVESLRKDMVKSTSVVEQTARAQKEAFSKVWRSMGGEAGKFAEGISRIIEGSKKVFGDGASAIGQKWGKELSSALGLTDEKVKGLEQTIAGLQGAFKIVGGAIALLTSPISAVIAAVAGIAMAWGAVRNAIDASGSSTDGLMAKMNDYLERLKVMLRHVPGVKSFESWVKGGGPSDAFDQILKDLKAGASRTLSDLGIKNVGDILTPGTTKAERARAAGERDSLIKAGAEALQFDVENYVSENAARFKDLGKRLLDPLMEEMKKGMQKTADEAADYFKQMDDLDSAMKNTDIVGGVVAKNQSRNVDIASGRFFEGDSSGQMSAGKAGVNVAAQFAFNGSRYASAASQGAQAGAAGGPWGMVIGGAIGLMSTTSGWQTMMAKLDGILGPLADLLGSLAEAIAPIIEVVGNALKPVFAALKPAFSLVGTILKGVASLLGSFNNLFWSFMKGLGDLIEHIPGQIGDAGERLKRYSVNNMVDIEGIWNPTNEAVKSLGDSTSQAAVQINQFARSITNMPSFYKVEHTEASAAIAGVGSPYANGANSGYGIGEATPTGAVMTGPVPTNHGSRWQPAKSDSSASTPSVTVNINTLLKDPKEVAKLVLEEAKRAGMATSGTPVPLAPPFYGKSRLGYK